MRYIIIAMLVVQCAAADVFISQVFPSGDMVELYNDGSAVNITGWSLMTEKSDADAVLEGVMLPYSYYTIGDVGSGADWEEAISLYNSDSGVALADEEVVDAVGWGETSLVMGSSAPNPGQLSLVRINRSGNNSADFSLLPPNFGKGIFAEVVVKGSWNWSVLPGMVKHVEVPASSYVVWQGEEYAAADGFALVPLHYTAAPGEHELVVDGVSRVVSISPTCFLQPASRLFISGSAGSSAVGSVEFMNLGNVPCSPSLLNSTVENVSFSMETAVIGVNSSAYVPILASLPEELGVYRGRLLFG